MTRATVLQEVRQMRFEALYAARKMGSLLDFAPRPRITSYPECKVKQ